MVSFVARQQHGSDWLSHISLSIFLSITFLEEDRNTYHRNLFEIEKNEKLIFLINILFKFDWNKSKKQVKTNYDYLVLLRLFDSR